ncbi:hypothetical protein BFN03_11925 [Rhodococcus sp. WMMA185]|uniref:DUF4232 domain-containing protein n=1 Tax=Rhodococcus sp. WMMA185 TaxID=679318 RepID=UPI000878DD67|nr:DUF4232 domain-containing protein [Rhodococcus sp. WMMA185]AOW93120.1 hypothetical protein BFN03_11925 [Rhodococcus sp. WMMA185]
MVEQSPLSALVAALGLFAVLTASGCGADESGTGQISPDSSTEATSKATGTASPTAGTALPSSESTPPATGGATPRSDRCLVDELRVTVGHVEGAAGSQEISLDFTNTGSRTCILQGYPGVSYVAAPGGAQVGSAATRDDGSGSPVTVTPGASVTAAVRATVVQNYPAETCGPAPVAGFRVYPPGDTGSVFVPYPSTGCSQTGIGVDQLSVRPVTG